MPDHEYYPYDKIRRLCENIINEGVKRAEMEDDSYLIKAYRVGTMIRIDITERKEANG